MQLQRRPLHLAFCFSKPVCLGLNAWDKGTKLKVFARTFWPISVEFPLMWWYSIGFDMWSGWLQRSVPVKPSSSVTLMTFPRGCHESVCCGPALPHSMCVKRCGICSVMNCWERQLDKGKKSVKLINILSHLLICRCRMSATDKLSTQP